MIGPPRFQDRNLPQRDALRVRRAILLFLILLAIVVFARTASSAEGASPPPAGAAGGELAGARIALYDPEGKAAPALAAIGVRPEVFPSFEGLALFQGDLIVIGPGGFARGREELGPVLAARARSGMRLLLLEQPSLPGTLSDDLRLWPSFTRTAETTVLTARRHPIMQGLPAAAASASLASDGARPLLPPTRGNFRVIAEVRVRTGPAWQEGVTLLEFPLGAGLVLAAQSSLCSEAVRDPGARALLSRTLAYLLGPGHGMKRAFFYGGSTQERPSCLARLAPDAPPVPPDLADVEALLVPGDWRAGRAASRGGLPPAAEVARYLREGGTVLLLNPQPLALEHLRAIVGVPVFFEDDPAAPAFDALPALFDGIAPEDLEPLRLPGRPEFRLRSLPGADLDLRAAVPGLSEYRVGRGTLVALSLPDPSDCAAPRVSGLVARILTNLGIPLDHAPGVDPETVSRLDE